MKINAVRRMAMSTEDTIKILGQIRRKAFVTASEFDIAICKAIEVMTKQITMRSSW